MDTALSALSSLTDDRRELYLAARPETVRAEPGNLAKYKQNERQIIASFDNDISRFKVLKGIQ